MFARDIYITRRSRLIEKMGCGGVVLLPGSELSPNSYPSNSYYFRQDATFRYFFGSDRPSLWGLIDLESGESMLFGEDSSLDDLIWTGAQPLMSDIASEVGARAMQVKELEGYISRARGQNRVVHILPPYRGETKIRVAELLDCSVLQLSMQLSADLIFAVAELREVKGSEEIEALESVYYIGREMHLRAMQMSREGVVEREIGGCLEGVARSMGAGVSFPPICTQHGETLHNIEREGVLESGRLFLCDAGGESLEGYCSDHTRTYPISGRFTAAQRDIYNIVLAAYESVKRVAHPGMLYRDLQASTYRVLGEGLRDLGLLRGSMDEILESNVVSLFMPHGVGHGLGLDVHDCEAMGERTFDVARFGAHAERSTSCIIRSSWRLSEGTVMTDEPGIYFIPALIERRRAEGLYRDLVNYDMVEDYLNFGGIRIEDDILITGGGCRQIGAHDPIPVTIDELENYLALWR